MKTRLCDRTRAARWGAIVVAFVLLVAPGPVSAKNRNSSPRLSVVVRGADPGLADETIRTLQEVHQELVSASGVGIPDTVHVYYVGREQSFDSLAGGRMPDWGVGVAVADEMLIAIRSPRDYPVSDQLRTILRHEFAHLHLEAILGWKRPPRWMHEGYAQQYAHQWSYGDDWTVARAVFTNNVLPLADIDGVNSFRDAKAKLAYAESYLAMGYFLETYGWDGLMLLARSMRQGGDWDDAFSKATGADYASFQTEFMTYLKDRFNWAAFLGDTALLWIVLALLFLVLYLIKRRRTDRKMTDWEHQESIEDILYSPFDKPPDTPSPPSHGS